jgi:hypothetical protein
MQRQRCAFWIESHLLSVRFLRRPRTARGQNTTIGASSESSRLALGRNDCIRSIRSNDWLMANQVHCF